MTSIAPGRVEAVCGDIERVVIALLGSPSHRGGSEIRYGRQGSLAIDLDKQLWYDHERGEGGDAINLIQNQMNLDFRAALFFGEELLGLDGEAQDLAQKKPYRRPSADSNAKATKPKPRGISREANAVWSAALRLDGSVGGRYLEESRRCGIPGHHCSRYVPALKYFLSNQIFPCIASLITDAVTGAPLSLHVAFLAHNGRAKAPVEKSRLFWPALPAGGGVVRLSPDDQVETGLILSEGLEDGESLLDHGMAPVWACLTAGEMGKFPVLAGVEALTICADADIAGRRAATKCMERWTTAGREVTVTFPHGAAKDFNEVAVARANA